jgi:predicted AAA+ superfamily ATPase
LSLLKGIDHTATILLDNTRRFAAGLPANNALLWGARGMGKSSLVKAAHAEASLLVTPSGGARTANSGIPPTTPSGIPPTPGPSPQGGGGSPRLILVEIHREDIDTLPACLSQLKASPHRFIVFCDDLSFDKDDTSYKSLKAVLEGGIEGRPSNVLFYATSNRRHLMPRDMVDNERSTAINPSEAVEEKVSLSDRFGLWLGFHNASQDAYLAMVHAYVAHYGLKPDAKTLDRDALEWSTTRGARSGRVAWQFIQDLAGRMGHVLD